MNNKILISILFLIIGCSQEATEEKTTTEITVTEDSLIKGNTDTQEAVNERVFISLWNRISLHETPSEKEKPITSVYFGESGLFLDAKSNRIVAESGKEYFKVRLKDSTEGWIDSKYIVLDAEPYVVTKETKLYKRPDILTPSTNSIKKMQYIVVVEENDEWLKIKTKKEDGTFMGGWLKSNYCSNNKSDIAVAILSGKAMENESRENIKQALNEILNNPEFKESVFISDIKRKVSKIKKIEDGYTDSLIEMVKQKRSDMN